MPRNGSGVYSLPSGNPVVTGTVISSTWCNNTMNDIASALTGSIAANGETAVTGDQDLGGNTITNLGAGTSLTDAATILQIQNQSFNWCGTAGGSADALTLTPAPAITAYVAGQPFVFKSGAAGNTAATTVAVSGLSTRAIQSSGSALSSGDIAASKWYRITYDGAAFQLEPINLGGGGSGTFSSINVSGTSTLGDVDATGAITFSGAGSIDLPDGTVTVSDLSAAAFGVAATNANLGNGYITAAAAANAITIALKTLAGADASATAPITVMLRDATLSDGSLDNYQVTGALSAVISSGSTLGCASAESVRIHIAAMLNASTGIELLFWTATVASLKSIQRLSPNNLITTTAEGGAGAADSAQTPYSTTQRTDQPWTYLGYIEATSGVTAGQWASVDKIVNFQPGMPMPGDVVQTQLTITGAVATGTTIIPGDDSIPQKTEGDQYMTQAITPVSALNKLDIISNLNVSDSTADYAVYAALFQDSGSNALAAHFSSTSTTAGAAPMSLHHFTKAGTTSSTTFYIRMGPNQASTVTFNGASGSRAFGGVLDSYIKIEEIQT